MHPTANSAAFIRKTWMLDTLNARRVMPGVMRLSRAQETYDKHSHLPDMRGNHNRFAVRTSISAE